jgi:hypothetical protein
MSGEDRDPRTAYWSSLEQGRLRFQRCAACENRWLPPRTECPRCWSAEWAWEEASGEGRVVSWVVFHTAFHEAFRDRVPYNVAVVELAEGPRLVTNLIEPVDGSSDVVDRRCTLEIERDHDKALPRFRLA